MLHTTCKRSNLLWLVRQNFLGKSISTVTTSLQTSKQPPTPEVIISECGQIRAAVQAINDKFRGPLEKSSQKNTILPFVFLLGNHSSGKSSFINYVCQRKIQTSGVAPTDDTFTVIVPGPADVDRDGPSFVGDPDMGFAGLRIFGPQLVHHSKLKIRSNIAIRNFMMVDSPGMIDSPMVRDQYSGGNLRYAAMDRGYDFENVCRWFSERADVILLFFDPDKPGTTGETLSIMTNSLVGLDHKLHIILNKADQFKKIHDFARAYGSLCWNLSKVIQRKDLPRIYTMCLPKAYQILSGDALDDGTTSLAKGLADLEETREEVVAEVLNAPKRRVDNEITRLTDSVSLLQMHLTIIDDLVKEYRNAIFYSRLQTFAGGVLTIGLTGGSIFFVPIEISIILGVTGTLLTGGNYWRLSRILTAQSREIVKSESLKNSYRKLYARRIAEKDEFTGALWNRVLDHFTNNMTGVDFATLEKVKAQDFKELERVLEVDIPKLRRKAAPAFHNTFS